MRAHDAQQVSLYALDSSTAQPSAAAMSPQDLNWCRAYPCSAVSACTTSERGTISTVSRESGIEIVVAGSCSLTTPHAGKR